MKKIKTYKGWGIFKNNPKEKEEYGFEITVLHPDNMEYRYLCTPADSDMEINSLEEAKQWIDNWEEK